MKEAVTEGYMKTLILTPLTLFEELWVFQVLGIFLLDVQAHKMLDLHSFDSLLNIL